MAERESVIRVLLVHGDSVLLHRLQMAAPEIGGRRMVFSSVDTLNAALSLLAKQSFDAVLLNWILPDAAGLSAIDQLRHASPHSPVVVLSAYNDLAVALQAFELGAQDYLCTGRSDFQSVARSVYFAMQRDRKHRELLQSKEAAELASSYKTRFLANVSHEIRTPMSAILGFAEQLLDPQLSEDERTGAVQTICRNGDHLLNVVNDILDLSKIEAGKLHVEHVRCSPAQIMDDVLSLLRMRAESKRLKLSCQAEGALPQVICTDPMRLRQILINLLCNAIKFTQKGEIRLLARCRRPIQDDLRIEFEVQDTGAGMNQAEVSQLFRAFSQVAADSPQHSDGTGLGLIISKQLASLLGGDITVASRPEFGSCFRLDISGGPSAGVSLIEFDAKLPPIPPPRIDFPAPHRRLAGRLLLAEDGPDSQRLLAYILSKAGAELVIVEDGQLAVERVQAAEMGGQPFDLILMDMQMPVLDGYAATRQLREAGFQKPILALTAFAMSSDRERCLAAGCDDFISKPIDRAGLLRKIGQWLDASSEEALALCSPVGQFQH